MGWNINGILIELAMGFEIDMNKFRPIGEVTGILGEKYMILIEISVPQKRAVEICRQRNENKLEIKGHVYDPGREIREILRRDLDEDCLE